MQPEAQQGRKSQFFQKEVGSGGKGRAKGEAVVEYLDRRAPSFTLKLAYTRHIYLQLIKG